MSEFEEAREAFRGRWGFDPSPFIAEAVRAGEFELEGGDEDARAFIRRMLADAGDCAHCGLPIDESHLLEFVAREIDPAGVRPVTVLVHTRSGHERCEGRDTVAERGEPEARVGGGDDD